ncbi:unnamed protein product [Brachionus calyciflorus]|uniref:Sacsin/Nov domain-containing protein n=1 Tax=Brachionus calyciflorus TaxID=104777 RepID=A0A813ZHF6_9BILA|nr:unnamed protein product [Brachionus calyciflorus]
MRGQTFCFLPLSIYTSLSFNLNGPFLLSEDRLNLYEKAIDDKSSNNLYKWNEYLLNPFVDNLILMINYSFEILNQENLMSIFSLWPIEMKTDYFKKFELCFYDEVCSANLKMPIFPTLINNQIKLLKFVEAIFVDFDFKLENIQQIALNSLKLIISSNQYLVVLPSKYLTLIKSKTLNHSQFINDYDFLRLIISNAPRLDINDYYGTLIKSSKCIPTCKNNFKLIGDLIEPKSNEHFKNLFSIDDDLFPHEYLCENNQSVNSLINLGLVHKYLKIDVVLILAKKVSKLSNSMEEDNFLKAKILSQNLCFYLNDYFRDSMINKANFPIDSLQLIEWIFPEPKPNNWLLPWFVSENGKKCYKPIELYGNQLKDLIGSVRPLFNSKYLNFINQSNKSELLKIVVEQFILIKQNYESNSSRFSDPELIDYFIYFKKFYFYLQSNSTESSNISDGDLDKILQTYINILPEKWIFCPENNFEYKFLSADSLAFQVENQSGPDMFKLSETIVGDHKSAHFFEKMGVRKNFSLNSLRLKLVDLKNEFNSNPLDEINLARCFQIVKEIIHVDKTRKDKIYLEELIKQIDFYLPDEKNVMRNLKNLCYEPSVGMFFNDYEVYPVHPDIPSKKFGISSAKAKLINVIGESFNFEIDKFGQKENLIDRIKDILKRYSSESCIFKELIQNADDAKATKISFILDTRNLNREYTFDESFNELQGPALCCFNNSIFTEENLQGIISLGKGSKRDKLEETGRFGVGFNSVYHLTDAPQLLSNLEDYVLLDPLCKHFPNLESSNPGLRIKNARKSLQNDLFKDVFSGFQIPDFPLENSTMFRFSLRKSISKINLSNSTYDSSKLETLFVKFFESSASNEILLFLKNIREINFYKLGESGELTELNRINLTMSEPNIEKKEIFKKSISNFPKFTSFINLTRQYVNYYVNINSFNMKKEFVIFEQFGFDTKSDPNALDFITDLEKCQNKIFELEKPKNFPLTSIALDTDIFREDKILENKWKIFNFLPLEQESPLKCHINAYWALHQENRTHIYEFASRNENVDKDLAKWLSDWNLCLINYGLLPVYLEMVKYIQKNYSDFLGNNEEFITKYFEIFPTKNGLNEKLRPYFDNFVTKFYSSINNLPVIPIQNDEKIEWFQPSELYFSINFESYFTHKSRIDKMCDIIKKSGVNICRHNKLVNLFRENSEIEMKKIDYNILINGFKGIKEQLVGKQIEDTLFERCDNLKGFLIFIYSTFPTNTYNHSPCLEDCPMLLRHDLTLTKFSSSNKHLIYYDPGIFINFEDRFLHESFYEMFNSNKEWFRNININDLTYLLPSLLPKDFFYLKNKTQYPDFNLNIKEKLCIIWDIIGKYLNSFTHLEKSSLLASLDPIKDWALIPVKIGDTNYTKLAPIRDSRIIIYATYNDYLYNIIHTIDFPNLDHNILGYNVYIANIVTVLSKNQDFINFLLANQEKCAKIFNEKNTNYFFEYFNKNIVEVHRRHHNISYIYKLERENSISESSITSLIKSLPIFEDLFGCADKINNLNVLMIDLIGSSHEIRNFFRLKNDYTYEFKDFANHCNYHIIEYNPAYSKLYKYLNINTTSIEDIYLLFFKWVQKICDFKLLKYHIEILETQGLAKLQKSAALWDFLKILKFININGKFYSINQVYDDQNALFKIAYEKFIIPEELRTPKWRTLLSELGLKKKCDSKDCIQIANVLREKYMIKKIDLNTLSEKIELLFWTIVNIPQNNHLINELKFIKFIPNGLLFNNNKTLLFKIENPILVHGELICLANSTFLDHENLIWIVKPVLPFYLTSDYKNLFIASGVVLEPSLEIIIKNFLKLIEILSKNKFDLLNKLSKYELTSLKFLLQDYYKKFQQSLKINSAKPKESSEILANLINQNIILVKSRQGTYRFCKANQIVKNISNCDQIDGFMYKLSRRLIKYWNVLNHLGALETVSLSNCNRFLLNLGKNRNGRLDDEEYKSVLIIIKFLIFENILDSNNFPNLMLYFPNLNREMKPLQTLFYADKSAHERILQNNEKIKSITLFDIKDLSNLIHNSYKNSIVSSDEEDSKQSDLNQNNSVKNFMFNQMNWTIIFKIIQFFQNYPHLGPKPLSSILVEKILNPNQEKIIDYEKMNKINTKEFLEAVIECIKLVNDDFVLESNDELRESLKKVIMNIRIYRTGELKTHFIDLNTGEPFENSERTTNIARLKSLKDNTIEHISKIDFSDSLEDSFYLSETFLESIKIFLGSLKSTNETNSIQDSLIKRPHRFILLLMKLIQSEHDEESYRNIIHSYKSTSPIDTI